MRFSSAPVRERPQRRLDRALAAPWREPRFFASKTRRANCEVILARALSPETLYTVAIEEGFIADENELVGQRLRDEHAVKRIAMWSRQ